MPSGRDFDQSVGVTYGVACVHSTRCRKDRAVLAAMGHKARHANGAQTEGSWWSGTD